MKKIVLAVMTAGVLVTGAFANKCSIQQIVYSSAHENGVSAKSSGANIFEHDAYVKERCVGVVYEVHGTDSDYNLCLKGADDGFNGIKSAKNYKKSCVKDF